jgi:Carboxypeptidase regulatory-like domain
MKSLRQLLSRTSTQDVNPGSRDQSGQQTNILTQMLQRCLQEQPLLNFNKRRYEMSESVAGCLVHCLNKWNMRTLAITAMLGLAMFGSVSFAQSGAGSIQGTVTDSTGAAIPGASVHVVENSSSTVFDTKSNGAGFYTAPSLFTGTYTVTYSAPEFKSYQISIELQVAQNAVISPALTPGAVTQQVEVNGDLIQLTTKDSGTISSVLENERINQLPMNGRSVLTLSGMVTPGLEDGGQMVNGLRPEALEYVQDGATLANRNFGGENQTQAQLPDPDAVQEVRISTTNASAQYAEPGTAIITTRSGTNALHGSAFETARNNYFGIAKRRQDPYNLVTPQLVRNEFGASIGGPIVIPHIYDGKTNPSSSSPMSDTRRQVGPTILPRRQRRP